MSRWDKKDLKARVATFNDFIKFLTEQVLFLEIYATIKKRKNDKTGNKPASCNKKSAPKQDGKNTAVAATYIEPTATMGRGGGRRKKEEEDLLPRPFPPSPLVGDDDIVNDNVDDDCQQ